MPGRVLSGLADIYIDYSEGAEMTKANNNRGGGKNMGRGHAVKDCPIHFEVCYPSCYFWRGKCRYDQIISSAHEKGLCENSENIK